MVTILLVISHWLGDFVLQSAQAAVEKQKSFAKLVKHCLLYALVVALGLLLSIDLKHTPLPFLLIALSHFAIDWARVKIDSKATARVQLASYFLDQFLHILIIFCVTYYLNLNVWTGGLLRIGYSLSGQTLINNWLVYGLIFLTMLQPAAVTVKKMLAYISIRESNDKGVESAADISLNDAAENGVPYNAGYLIGILERIIVAMLVLQNELSAIGFVLAAKSLARFKQLDDQEFAEKYLVGSLTSVAIAIMVTLVLKGMLR